MNMKVIGERKAAVVRLAELTGEQAGIAETKPLMKWCAVELPAVGGGAWRR